MRVDISLPLYVSHTLMDLSLAAVAKYLPELENLDPRILAV